MAKHYLFLQGPLGPFWGYLSSALTAKGHRTSKVAFNGGDLSAEFAGGVASFCEHPNEWSGWISRFFRKKEVTDLIVYNDSRFYHSIAIEKAKSEGVRVWVFEEGYLRPDFITIEKNGVNGNSEFELVAT